MLSRDRMREYQRKRRAFGRVNVRVEIEFLGRVREYLREYDDSGPEGETWKSDRLISDIEYLDKLLT